MRIGRVAGVTFRLNFLFLMILIAYSALGLVREILCIFASVLVHELAHTIVAGLLGIRISEVELFPFGGQAKTEDFLAASSEREIYVALAGPLASFLLAGGAYVATNLGEWNLLFFVRVNLALGLFNLLPALPLDGGRILRAALARGQGYRRATHRAALLGRVVAVLLVGYGVYQTYYSYQGANLIFIGVFLFWAVSKESRFLAYAFMRYLINKKGELSRKGLFPVNQVVSTARTPIKVILNSTSPSSYLLVVLVDEKERVQGMVTESELIEALFEKGPLVTLGELVRS